MRRTDRIWVPFGTSGTDEYGEFASGEVRQDPAALRAWKLSTTHPATGVAMTFTALPPLDLTNLLWELGSSWLWGAATIPPTRVSSR